MRRILVSLAAAAAFVAAASLAPGRAEAMTVGTVPGIQDALAETSLTEDVAYVCRHRYWSSRRVCWWRPGRYYGYYGGYRPYYRPYYGYYRPYYGYGYYRPWGRRWWW
jgi:hypothetical protein